jgi:hypothetical protein
MTEMIELVATAFLESELEKCPFKDETKGAGNVEEEGIGDDDDDEVQSQQQNDGGVLGENLTNASPGADGTVGGPCEPPKLSKTPARDTQRGGGKVLVAETFLLEAGAYPFTVAAHHLIPGNAALKKSPLMKFMTKGQTVQTTSGKSWKIKDHIGYNVNGNHNGVWLAGNYAIRRYKGPSAKRKEARPNTSPVGGATGGVSWSGLPELGHEDWQLHYVAGACRISSAQFHDTHANYSENVLELLNKIAAAITAHQEKCEDCAGKLGQEVPPPYLVKNRLYGISDALKVRVLGIPVAWKDPWFTSDRWAEVVFKGTQVSEEFCLAYNRAHEVPAETASP